MIPSKYSQAFACGVEAWSEFWGDPLFSGTLMVVTYAIAAFATLRVSFGLRGVERAIWSLATAFMAFQVVNTPFDFTA